MSSTPSACPGRNIWSAAASSGFFTASSPGLPTQNSQRMPGISGSWIAASSINSSNCPNATAICPACVPGWDSNRPVCLWRAAPRYDRSPRVGLRGLWTLGMNAVFSFSYVPLFVFRIAGVLSIGLSVVLVLSALVGWLAGHALDAWSSILIATSFLGGINLLGVGLLGEYIARIYDEVKCRPAYVVDRVEETEGEEQP